ncbi:MAG: alanine:cation symporter family protein, partial [Candidatus Babeliales bacterium]
MNINDFVVAVNHVLWGWPLIIYILAVAGAATVMLNFIQFTHFFESIKLMFFPAKKETTGDMTPFQALVNALNTSIGNGSIAGIATAIYSGGPGAAFWVFVFGYLSIYLRFAELFL